MARTVMDAINRRRNTKVNESRYNRPILITGKLVPHITPAVTVSAIACRRVFILSDTSKSPGMKCCTAGRHVVRHHVSSTPTDVFAVLEQAGRRVAYQPYVARGGTPQRLAAEVSYSTLSEREGAASISWPGA